jgi:RNA polymerase sigma-70 factor, ECF subfamily
LLHVQDDVRDQLLRLLPRLRRFAQTLTCDRDRADDLVQDTIVRALTRIDQFQPGTRLDSWMFKIAQNLWFNRLSAATLRGPVEPIDAAEEVMGSDGRDVTENRLTLAAVNRGIKQLPVNQRVLIALVCVEGLSYKEAADVLDVPIGTVMSRLARARTALFAAIEPSVSDLVPATASSGVRFA